MALLTLSNDQITTIQRYIELQGIITMEAMSSQSYSVDGISHREELAGLKASYKVALETYRELSNLVITNANAGTADADAIAAREERGRLMALFTAAKIHIEDVAHAYNNR
jgi:hypothetical protein